MLPNTVLSPASTPSVLDQPAGFSVPQIPANQLQGVARSELLVVGVNLIYTPSVDQEISIDWNDDYNWAVVENLLLYVFQLGGNAIIRYLKLRALGCFSLAILSGTKSLVVG